MENEEIGVDWSNLDELFTNEKEDIKKEQPKTKVRKNIISKIQYRRAYSESQLLDILPKEIKRNECWQVISNGDIDSFSFLKYILRKQDIKYLIMSTWCMAMTDIEGLEKYIENKQLLRLDVYVGEIFPGTYGNEFEKIKKVVKPDGRVAIFRNHSKVLAGHGNKFDFAITSSANINTNPRAENTTMFFDKESYNFYKDYFDLIVPFNNDFEQWKKY